VRRSLGPWTHSRTVDMVFDASAATILFLGFSSLDFDGALDEGYHACYSPYLYMLLTVTSTHTHCISCILCAHVLRTRHHLYLSKIMITRYNSNLFQVLKNQYLQCCTTLTQQEHTTVQGHSPLDDTRKANVGEYSCTCPSIASIHPCNTPHRTAHTPTST
jgi:hypothetical protein